MVAIVGIAIGLIMAVAAVLLAENMGFVSVVQTKHEVRPDAIPPADSGTRAAPPNSLLVIIVPQREYGECLSDRRGDRFTLKSPSGGVFNPGQLLGVTPAEAAGEDGCELSLLFTDIPEEGFFIIDDPRGGEWGPFTFKEVREAGGVLRLRG